MDADDARFDPLLTKLRSASGAQCPFVVADAERLGIQLTHYSGGQDATYVFVSRSQQSPSKVITIAFAPYVEGTTLIYDLTDETLQGKARPFACDLTETPLRVYALLPVQIEEFVPRLRYLRDGFSVSVEFHDAAGDRIQAALPFHLALGGKGQFCCTNQDGIYSRTGSIPGESLPLKLTIRSQLTGREQSVTL